MEAGFLLAHPSDALELTSEALSPARACSYTAAVSLLRGFAQEYKNTLTYTNQYFQDDYSKITMHSLRAWLATFARQVGVPPSEINELLHWTQGSMARLYNRNFSAIEVSLRARILKIMGSTPWRSAIISARVILAWPG